MLNDHLMWEEDLPLYAKQNREGLIRKTIQTLRNPTKLFT